MSTLFGMFPFLKTLFADSGYKKFLRISALKSSSAPIRSADLWSCPNAGSLLIRSKFSDFAIS
jgi:hypothetical protein